MTGINGGLDNFAGLFGAGASVGSFKDGYDERQRERLSPRREDLQEPGRMPSNFAGNGYC